jgi:ribulose-5-phosphate 4-epimerase/fuculose-1-phosphate aldolase
VDAVESLKEKMVLACKVLQNQGVVDVYGHVSARLADDRILSTPHMPPGKVALRDLIILDMHGKKLEGFGEPNGETAMHTSIYKARPDVQCVLHYHPDELVTISISGHGIKVVANCGVHSYRGTPIYDSPVLIRTDELGDKIARLSEIATRCSCAGMEARWWPTISTRCCAWDSIWCARPGFKSWHLLLGR